MNRISKEYLAGGRTIPTGSQHRRGRSFTRDSRDTDENLDLFSGNRRGLSVASSDESDVSVKLGRISVGSAKLARSGMDDLLSSVDGEKHDYDWLLTPPGTPLVPSSIGSELQPTLLAPKSSSSTRSVSTTKASRLSVTQSENGHSSRPTRSNSVTRPSISSMQHSTYSSTSNRSSSILNTSSTSVTSYNRPSTPTARSTFPSTARPSTPSARPVTSRSSTPAKSRPVVTSSSTDKTRASQNPRPSTPNSRSQVPANLNSSASRSNTRPSTPTRRTPSPAVSSAAGRSPSVGRVPSNGRNPAQTSRPSSPAPRARTPQQPIVPPDFPLDTPPNLRTTLPDRPLSAGRSRPGAAVTVKGNLGAPATMNQQKRQSSPVISRGRLPEPPGKGRLYTNGHGVDPPECRKTPPLSESAMRRPAKPATATESTGFGRTISKKSLDMALRHMDIRNGAGSIRPLSGTSLFPQSIRSCTLKEQPSGGLETTASVSINGEQLTSKNSVIENGRHIRKPPKCEAEEDNGRLPAKLSEPDIYQSSRYDEILLKEDLQNTNWLHSVDDKSDQGPIFDHRFEQLPEPFGLL